MGHIGLITRAKEESSLVVSSIFVNPTQFNDPKDFEKYPNTLASDIDKLEAADCDILFIPSVAEIYPDGAAGSVRYDLGMLETILDGHYRPGHFQGVCQVVDRLFKIVQPHQVYFGQKDYQQCMMIKKLLSILRLDIRMVICPTQREATGLAMSSRNMRLSDADKIKATAIYTELNDISNAIKKGETDLVVLKQKAVNALNSQGFKTDYVEIAHADTLQLLDKWDGTSPIVTLAAAFLNGVRLIDNVIIA